MTFQTPYTVQHHPASIVTEDELGNDEIIFSAPVSVPVIQIAPVTAEPLGQFSARQITDVDLYAPPEFNPSLQDRITLPDGRLFEVIGVADWTQGFHQWPAGRVVQLKRVTG